LDQEFFENAAEKRLDELMLPRIFAAIWLLDENFAVATAPEQNLHQLK